MSLYPDLIPYRRRPGLLPAVALALAWFTMGCDAQPCERIPEGANTDVATNTSTSSTDSIDGLLGGGSTDTTSNDRGACAGDSDGGSSERPLQPPGFIDPQLVEGQGVEFTWVDSNAAQNNEDGYQLERRLPNLFEWSVIEVYPADTTGGFHETAAESTSFFYRVVAFRNGVTRPSSEIRVDFPDITPPDTVLLFHPPLLTNNRSANFVFKSSEGAGSFECTLRTDDGEPQEVSCGESLDCLLGETTCRAVAGLGELSEGTHRFEARAVDRTGNADPTPISYTWDIDLTPPTVQFAEGSIPPVVTSGDIEFNFNSDDDDASYTCQVIQLSGDPATTIAKTPCTPAQGFPVPFPGNNATMQLSIVAWDLLGNTANPKTHTFHTDQNPPVISFVRPTTEYLQPVSPLDIRVVIDDPGTDPGSNLLSEDDPVLCTWFYGGSIIQQTTGIDCVPDTYIKGDEQSIARNTGTQDGSYALTITATDIVGNAATKTIEWFYDSRPPFLEFVTTPIDLQNPPTMLGDPTAARTSFLRYVYAATNPMNNNSPSDGSEDEIVRQYYCSWDEPGNTLNNEPCDPQSLFERVARGSYTFTVTATDLAGNASSALVHDVVVNYPGYSMDIGDAAGDAIVPVAFDVPGRKNVSSGTCSFNQATYTDPINPYLDPHWAEVRFQEGQATLRYHSVNNSGSSSTYRIFGSQSGDESFVVGAGSSVTNNAFIADNNPFESFTFAFGSNCGRHYLDFFIRETNFDADTRARYPLAMFGRNAVNNHIATRIKHPQPDWVAAGGTTWQTTVMIDTKMAPTNATVAVHLEVPDRLEPFKTFTGENDRIATNIINLDDLYFDDNGQTYVEVAGETPHCAGMAQVRTQIWSNGQIAGASGTPRGGEDFARFAVSDSTTGLDRYDSPPLENSTLVINNRLELANLRLEGADPVTDYYPIAPNAGLPVTVQVIERTGTGTQLYLTLLENGAPIDVDIATGNVSVTTAFVNGGSSYGASVSTPALNGCVRYRLHIWQ